jgi:hypothetical protein
MQLDIGAVALAIVIAIAAILVVMLLVLAVVRSAAKRRQRFLGGMTAERPYRPVDLLDATEHDNTELPKSSTEEDR